MAEANPNPRLALPELVSLHILQSYEDLVGSQQIPAYEST